MTSPAWPAKVKPPNANCPYLALANHLQKRQLPVQVVLARRLVHFLHAPLEWEVALHACNLHAESSTMSQQPKTPPLWAPWRIEYILSEKPGGCFLCQKGQSCADEAEQTATDIQNHVIARGEHCYVLLNNFPYNPGHIMISPYRHIHDLDQLTREERYEAIDLLAKAERCLKQVSSPQGFNAGLNLGTAAGAGIKDHVHFHLVPRWAGDTNFMPVIGEVRCLPEALDATRDALRTSWKDA